MSLTATAFKTLITPHFLLQVKIGIEYQDGSKLIYTALDGLL